MCYMYMCMSYISQQPTNAMKKLKDYHGTFIVAKRMMPRDLFH